MGGIDVKNLGTEIKIRRIRKGIPQKELAQELGISQTHLSNVENGRTMLSIESLLKVKRCLECTLDDLLDSGISSAAQETGNKSSDISWYRMKYKNKRS